MTYEGGTVNHMVGRGGGSPQLNGEEEVSDINLGDTNGKERLEEYMVSLLLTQLFKIHFVYLRNVV